MIRAFLIFLIVWPSSVAEAKQASWLISQDDGEFADPDKPLKRNAIIAKQRLLPKVLAVLNGNTIREDGGDRWDEEGAQLFGARVNDQQVFCSLNSKMNITLGSFLLPKKSNMLKQNCFADTDGDGRLDQRFTVDPGIGSLPNVGAGVPKNEQPILPVAYTLIGNGEFKNDSWVEVRYRGGGKKSQKPARFQIRYRYSGFTQSLTKPVLADISTENSSVSILGSTVSLHRSSTGDLFARVDEPMSAEFEVEVTIVRKF